MADKKSIRGTKTEQNILSAYIAESAAYSRYIFYAKQANKDQYFPIEQIFTETAENELHHAKVYFKFLEGGTLTIPVTADSGVIGTTAENLQTAINEENSEGIDAYLAYAIVAEQEGFQEIANHFRAIADVEKRHAARFQWYLDQVKAGTVWKREKPIKWQCLVCGYVYEGTTPPDVCPACDHPYQHYMALDYDEI